MSQTSRSHLHLHISCLISLQLFFPVTNHCSFFFLPVSPFSPWKEGKAKWQMRCKKPRKSSFLSLLQAAAITTFVCFLFAGEGKSRREHLSEWVHLLCSNLTSFFKNALLCFITKCVFFFLSFLLTVSWAFFFAFWLLEYPARKWFYLKYFT